MKPAWTATPRHIYMEGYNGHRGMEEGLLHIDTKLATVTFEPWVGKQLSESVILDECDLSKQDSKFKPSLSSPDSLFTAVTNANHDSHGPL